MATPTAAYSILLRVRLDNRPGTLGRLATVIGEAGGNISAIGGFDVRGAHLDEHLRRSLVADQQDHHGGVAHELGLRVEVGIRW